MSHVKPGRSAAAEMSLGTRAAQAGVGLCSTCRHPVRLHGDVGCSTGECWCNATGADLRAGVTTTAALAVPPSVAEMAHLDARCTCGHVRTEHRVTGSHVQCKVCRCGGFAAGAPAEPAPPVLAASVPARTPARKAQPRRGPAEPRLATAGATHERPRQPRARPTDPAALGSDAVASGGPDAVEEVAAVPPPAATVKPHTPGAGWARAKAELGDMVPDLTDEDERDLDRFLGTATQGAASNVRFDPLPAAVTATPAPLDLTPFLGTALYYYPAWFCKGCLQRRHNPGVCCRRPLLPVYVVIASREIP